MIYGVREVMFYVPDLVEARDWYEEFLGTHPVVDTPVYCQFKVGDFEVGLHPTDEKGHPGARGSVTYWEVDNIEEAIDKAHTLGAQLYRGPKAVGGNRKICQVIDPFGNAIGLTELF